MYAVSIRLNSFTNSYRPCPMRLNSPSYRVFIFSLCHSCRADAQAEDKGHNDGRGFIHYLLYRDVYGCLFRTKGIYNLPSMRSITQLTGVALTLRHLHTPTPCRSSITDLMMGSCTYGGFGTVMLTAPSVVMSFMGL